VIRDGFCDCGSRVPFSSCCAIEPMLYVHTPEIAKHEESLKAKNRGVDFLYKFRKADAYAEDILKTDRLYFASPREFNDPFDCRVRVTMYGSLEDWRRYYRTKFFLENDLRGHSLARVVGEQLAEEPWKRPNFIEEINEEMRSLSNLGVKILSLSAVRDDIKMWSMYSDSHSGVCFEFECDEGFGHASAVNYQLQYTEIDLFNGSDVELSTRTLLTKSKDWEYEKEYRLFEFKGAEKLRRFKPSALTGVIFGARIDSVRRATLRALAEDRTPKQILYQAKVAEKDYKIEIHKL
jgi:hypothetical protein